MSRTAGTRCLLAGAAVLGLLACSPATQAPPAPTAQPSDPAIRSQQALDDLVGGPEQPGCTAAVGERGRVVWQGVSGQADLESRTPLTPDSVVDMGSVAKQFTATALLVLEHEGRLSLEDRLSEHLDDLPSWADEVTLGQLTRHTSGVPEYIPLLAAQGVSLEMESTREEAVEVLREVEELDFRPGVDWAYSNSNYLLLGLVIESLTGVPLGDHLQSSLFRPLGLAVQPVVGSGGLHSYRRSVGGDDFELADWHWEVTGAGGLHATPSTLVQWADTYRTGAPAGVWLNQRRLEDAAMVSPDEGSYGAGIAEGSDGSLVHTGEWAGFHTTFGVSQDREHALAITCLRRELEPWDTAVQLSQAWFDQDG